MAAIPGFEGLPKQINGRLPGNHWMRSFVPPEARSGPEAERVRHPNPSWSSGDLRRACRLQHAVQEPDHGCGCGACEKRDFKNGAGVNEWLATGEEGRADRSSVGQDPFGHIQKLGRRVRGVRRSQVHSPNFVP